MNSFGKKLLALRKKSGLTQAELAEKLGVSPSTIGNYELGERIPRPNQLIEICKFFSVSSDFMLGLEDCSTDLSLALIRLKNQFISGSELECSGVALSCEQIERLFDFLLVSTNVIISDESSKILELYSERID